MKPCVIGQKKGKFLQEKLEMNGVLKNQKLNDGLMQDFHQI